MPNLTVVANIIAEQDHVQLVESELVKLIPITQQEEGCIQYDLQKDNENPAHFLFFEVWESEELLLKHLAAPHLQNFMATTKGAIATFTINKMTQIG